MATTDPRCATLTNFQIDSGAICYARPNGDTVFIETESYTGRVPTWGEVKDALDTMRDPYGATATQPYIRFNSSWYMYLSSLGTASDGLSVLWHIQQGEYGRLSVADSFVPPKFSVIEPPPPPRPNYLVDPNTGERLPISDSGTVTYPDGTTAPVFPSAPTTTVSPISPPAPVPAGGVVGDGTPIAGPLGSAPGSIPLLPPNVGSLPNVGGPAVNVQSVVQTAATSAPTAGVGRYLLWVIGGVVVWSLFG